MTTANNYRWTKCLSTGLPELIIDGEISSQTWYGDEVSPKLFKDELQKCNNSDIVVRINSPGGDAFAGAAIYTALKEYAGRVTVKIDGLAASAASVIAMAGDEIVISPTASMMIHCSSTIAYGNKSDFEGCIELLKTVDESMITAYIMKTGHSREKIIEMIERETWFTAEEAVENKFADRVMDFDKEKKEAVRQCIETSRNRVVARVKENRNIDAERQTILNKNKIFMENFERNL